MAIRIAHGRNGEVLTVIKLGPSWGPMEVLWSQLQPGSPGLAPKNPKKAHACGQPQAHGLVLGQ